MYMKATAFFFLQIRLLQCFFIYTMYKSLIWEPSIIPLVLFAFKSYFEEHLFARVSPFSWSGVFDPQSSQVYLPAILQHLQTKDKQ